MAKKKRRLSKYNLFVKKQVLAGRSFAQAARSWSGGRKLKTRTKRRVIKRKVKPMARRRSRARRVYSRARRAGSGMMMRGVVPIPALLKKGFEGVGAAALQERFLPQVIPYQSEAVGFVVGGLPGAAGAFAKRMFAGGGTGAGIAPGGGLY